MDYLDKAIEILEKVFSSHEEELKAVDRLEDGCYKITSEEYFPFLLGEWMDVQTIIDPNLYADSISYAVEVCGITEDKDFETLFWDGILEDIELEKGKVEEECENAVRAHGLGYIID